MTQASRSEIEDRTRAWLEESFLRAMAAMRDRDRGGDPYDEHGRPRHMTRYHFQELQRKLKIFRWLEQMQFESFIDVGSGIDVYPNRVRERYGVSVFFSDLVHSFNLPYGGDSFGRRDRAVTLNLESLPFPDAAFDVVLASEVLEHLVRPIEAIAELVRITRKMLIMTSLEARSVSRWERFFSHLRVDVRVPHVERNFFVQEEIQAIFGPTARYENLIHDPTLPASSFAPRDVQDGAYAALGEVSALVETLCTAVRETGHKPGAMGILLVRPATGVDVELPPREADPELARWLLERTGAYHREFRRLLEQISSGTAELGERDRPIAATLREYLRCPDCRSGGLAPRGSGLECVACGTVFRGEWGVPILYPTRSRDPDAALAEAIDRLCGHDQTRRRIVRRLARRLRRNERPPGRLRRLAWALETLLRRRV